MDAVCYVSDRNFDLRSFGPEIMPHPAAYVAVNGRHGVRAAGVLKRENGHAEKLRMVGRIYASQSHEILVRKPQFFAQYAQMLLGQIRRKTIVPCRYRCVRREDRV